MLDTSTLAQTPPHAGIVMSPTVAVTAPGPVASRAATGRMTVEVVESYDGVRRLKADWQALETRDPELTVFLTWAWLDRAFRDNPGRWRVFVVRSAAENGAAVAIFPTMLRARWNPSAGRLETGLVSGGRLILSDYTGILLDPAHEAAALRTLAGAMAVRPWSELCLAGEVAPGRARRFAAAFDTEAFEVRTPDDTESRVAAIRPTVALPDSYDSWLQSGPDARLAQRIRRFQRRFLGSGARRITVADASTFDRDAAIVLAPRRAAWAEIHGDAAADRMAANGRAVLVNAWKSGTLFMLILWEGDRALGGLAHVLDHEMDRVHVVQGGEVPGEGKASVGILLHAEAIRWAIAHGFGSYDFGRGIAPYKHAFGGRDRATLALTVRRRDADAPVFDRASLGDGLRMLSAMLKAGDTDAAKAAADQLAGLVR